MTSFNLEPSARELTESIAKGPPLSSGGWILGSWITHDLLTRRLAVGANAAVVFVEYSRAPEAKYPVQIEQCYAAAQWITEQGAGGGFDITRIAAALRRAFGTE